MFNRKKLKTPITIFACLTVFLMISRFIIPDSVDAKRDMYSYVRHVVDGDTIILTNGQKVRLIGVDTPEVYESDKLYIQARTQGVSPGTIQKRGKEASKFTKKLIGNRKVFLQFDPINEENNHRDRYGRLLAYVYVLGVKSDNPDYVKVSLKIDEGRKGFVEKQVVFLNASLIKSGNAEVFKTFDCKYKSYFYELAKRR